LKISVVIPSYNGWDRLSELCIKIKESLLNNFNLEDFEIIIVDDGSQERSDTYVKNLRDTGMVLKGVFLNKNCGQQLATLAGLRIAKGDYIVTMDDDLSHKPEDIKKLISMAENDNLDAVFGIPKNSRSGILRNTGSGLRDVIFYLFFRKPRKVSVSSFRVLNRFLVNKIINDVSEYKYLSVDILKNTKAIGNVKVEYHRESGRGSRYNFFELSSLALSLISCSRIFPKIIRKSKIASGMEWDLI